MIEEYGEHLVRERLRSRNCVQTDIQYLENRHCLGGKVIGRL